MPDHAQRQSVQPLVELQGVTKVYGSGTAAMQALRGVDLRIDEGEFVAVMGPSGSGKSTCMNILGCLDTPTAGRYLFKDVDVGGLSQKPAGPAAPPLSGLRFPGLQPAEPHLGPGECRAAPDLPGHQGRGTPPPGGRGPGRRGPDRLGKAHARASFPAASSSGWPSPGPSSPNPPCSWPTSRPATWIRPAAWRSWTC